MAQTASKFRSTNADLASGLQRLMGELDGLRARWHGLGAEAFDQARMHWNDGMKQLHQALDETANAIEKAGHFYTSTDTGSADRLKATQGGPSVRLPL
jgi:WXG100 family type VII secretion target